MPKLIRGPVREVRSRIFDSARWDGYTPRNDDIVIATYPKCGTTWTQRIVCMLTFGDSAPRSISDVAVWPDARFGPIEETHAQANAFKHRRSLKSHLPYDALPVYDGMKFIHVARDGRDAAMSFYNHENSYTPFFQEMLNQISIDDPKFASPFPAIAKDPSVHFHEWVGGEDARGDPGAGFWHMENSYWAARRDPNVLLVHYNDLKADRDGEMRRIADFLGIEIPAASWPSLVEGASFEAMQKSGDEIIPMMGMVFGDVKNFLFKGTNGRWQDVAAKEDLARYDEMVKANFSPALAKWIEHGRLVAGDPRAAPD